MVIPHRSPSSSNLLSLTQVWGVHPPPNQERTSFTSLSFTFFPQPAPTQTMLKNSTRPLSIDLGKLPWSSELSKERIAPPVFSLHATHFDDLIYYKQCKTTGFPGGSDGKESACNVGDPDLIPGSGRSPGEGNGNPLQYSCSESIMDRGAWWATVHGVAKSQARLSN